MQNMKEMKPLLEAIMKSAIRIKDAIDVKDIGYSQQENSSGETQLQLDIQCDMIIEEELSHVPSPFAFVPTPLSELKLL